MRRIFLRSQVTPYVILFIERDGSTYMISLMTSHPQIQSVYERFAVMKQKGASGKDQIEWARKFFSPPLITKYGAVGFKTKLVDILDKSSFMQLLIEKKVRIIQMQRRNQVKAVVSRINAKRLHDVTGNWNLYDEKERLPAFEIDPQVFHQYLLERIQADEELTNFTKKLNLPTLKMVYEDLLINRDQVLSKVFDFLGVDPFPVEGKTLKNTSDDLREVVLNFEQIRSKYLGTPFESMFDEVLV
jgi:LPS sulfotransferase NodH